MGRIPTRSLLLVWSLCLVFPPLVWAQQETEDQASESAAVSADDTASVYVLEPIVVEGRVDDLTGLAVSASQGFVGRRDLRSRPLVREGELLETVPGLVMTQHSGDGKSNQMFVRGFNLDHGTDFATRVDGMPVNIPTHAHGQGYTDLNFVVPELVDHVEYRLGGYYADIGDFGSAGGAHLRLRRSLDGPLARLGWGEDGYRRLVAAASSSLGPGELLLGGELKAYDGPWAVPQDLDKRAGMGRYSAVSGRHRVSLLALAYDNAWNASDQIPRRLVESGAIGRFGQVDETLGGASSRYSLSATWARDGADSDQRLDVYGIRYDLDLYSNFTYLLEHPVEGDQIQQADDGRRVLGVDFAHVQPVGRHTATAGVQLRRDALDVALRRTEGRGVLETVRADEATQWGTGAHVELESRWTTRLRTVLGARADYHRFRVSASRPENSGVTDDAILSPKASLALSVADRTEAYLSAGLGFHSNDARGTVQSVDPSTGAEMASVDPLVRSRSAEVGLRSTPLEGWRTTVSAWTIDLDSELLFVGDAGTTEPSDASRRIGITWTNFYRLTPELSADLDIALARARFRDVAPGQDRIPGAMERVVTAGISREPDGDGPFAALRLRHFGSYPLIEDGSVRAPGTSLANLSLGWSLGDVRLAASVLNLLDARASDIQYLYRSRVSGEPPSGIEDVHFHPVEPRQLRLSASWGV